MTQITQVKWSPTLENINNLPDGLREYVHDLQTRCDPAGEVAQLIIAKDTIRQIEKEIGDLRLLLGGEIVVLEGDILASKYKILSLQLMDTVKSNRKPIYDNATFQIVYSAISNIDDKVKEIDSIIGENQNA